MKIRNDFVTNSSSSSFILSFKDEESVRKTLKEQFPDYIKLGWSAGKDISVSCWMKLMKQTD